jgi:hypothetical protein
MFNEGIVEVTLQGLPGLNTINPEDGCSTVLRNVGVSL